METSGTWEIHPRLGPRTDRVGRPNEAVLRGAEASVEVGPAHRYSERGRAAYMGKGRGRVRRGWRNIARTHGGGEGVNATGPDNQAGKIRSKGAIHLVGTPAHTGVSQGDLGDDQ